MPLKDKTKRRKYHNNYSKQHYLANREYYRAKNNVSREAKRTYIQELKEETPCT